MPALEEQVYGLQKPAYMEVLDSMPKSWVTSSWNIGRVSRTMTSRRATRLPFRLGGEVEGMGHLQGISQTFSPRRLGRLGRAANIDPSFYGEGSKIYSPFNFLSTAGNYMFKKSEKGHLPFVGETVNKYVGRGSGLLSGKFGLEEGEVPFSAGTLGRIAGMGKITRMSERTFARKSNNMLAALKDINPEFGGLSFDGTETFLGRKFAMSSAFGNQITGTVSGRAVGYIQGARAARLDSIPELGGGALEGAMKDATGAFAKGLGEGSEALARGKFLARASSYAPEALGAVSLVGDVVLVHDIAKMFGKGVGAALKGGAEALTSVQGSINKSIMGMGFKDNSVAQSSRARGVMAIQNSQLNARSVLGSEASMAFAHFG